MKTPMQELKGMIERMTENGGDYDLLCVLGLIEDSFLEKEKQNKKQECIEFSKYIRNGKDHFNNGYSTEMVYDEWLEKSKKQRE